MIAPSGGATEEFLPEGTIVLKNTDTFLAPPMNTNYHVFDSDEMTECIYKRYNEINRERPQKIHDILSAENVVDQWKQIL